MRSHAASATTASCLHCTDRNHPKKSESDDYVLWSEVLRSVFFIWCLRCKEWAIRMFLWIFCVIPVTADGTAKNRMLFLCSDLLSVHIEMMSSYLFTPLVDSVDRPGPGPRSKTWAVLRSSLGHIGFIYTDREMMKNIKWTRLKERKVEKIQKHNPFKVDHNVQVQSAFIEISSDC